MNRLNQEVSNPRCALGVLRVGVARTSVPTTTAMASPPNARVAWMDRAGIPPAEATVLSYARALERVAEVDVGAVHAAASRDEATRIAAIGMIAHRRLVEYLLALAQASRTLVRDAHAPRVSGRDASR